MHIAIDARMYHIKGGHGRYLRELIKNLEQLDTQNQYTIILKPEGAALYLSKNPNFKTIITKTHWYTLGEQIAFTRLLYKLNADLVHFPHWNVPLLYRRPFIVTIHDLILRAYPYSAVSTRNPLIFWIKYLGFRIILRHALTHAAHITTVSNAAREQIFEYYPELLTEITVVTLAATPPVILEASRSEADRIHNQYQPDPIARPSDSLQDDRSYLLYIGTAYPHKNLPFLLHAFHQFGIRFGRTHQLVFAGARSIFYDRLLATDTAKTLIENGDLIYLDSPDDATLETLYANATAVICPALIEGFGLPALEAASRGIPVICSRIPAFEEILGDTATYFNIPSPFKGEGQGEGEPIESLIAVLHTVCHPERAKRAEGSNTDLIIRAQQFSWRKTAAKTLEVILNTHD